MLLSFVDALRQALGHLPREDAITFGLFLFVLSWVYPRRIVSLPPVGYRRTTLVWAGTAGSLLLVAVATVVSAHAVPVWGGSGFDGWWRRPAPLVAATLAVAVAGLALRRAPLPAPGERAISARRAWHTFASRVLLWVSGITATLVAVTALWQIAIATSAPKDGRVFGLVPEYTTLPIYMRFNNGYGYVAGAGWPNHLVTLIAIAIAIAVFFVVLRADVDRPLFARSSAPSVRVERESTAWLFGLILLAGLITTLGAVWMHTGFAGTSMVGLDVQSVSGNRPDTRILINGGYSAIARPMNLAGYLLQGTGVAVALRIAIDTVRAAHRTRRTTANVPEAQERTARVSR
jgi:hypothetical protein